MIPYRLFSTIFNRFFGFRHILTILLFKYVKKITKIVRNNLETVKDGKGTGWSRGHARKRYQHYKVFKLLSNKVSLKFKKNL